MKTTDQSSRRPTGLTLTAALALVFSLGAPEAQAVDADTCGALMGTYSIVPYSSWGTAPFAIQKTWNESDCNHRICEYMQRTFNVIPHLSWGSLPVRLQRVWDTPQVNCNAQVQNPPLLGK
ncbi:MAG: hypothetical protein NTV97_27060 [Alphaproteobacteria bacterium]|nr:hypothetical protein [Alphaproteobacteria bacterium]